MMIKSLINFRVPRVICKGTFYCCINLNNGYINNNFNSNNVQKAQPDSIIHTYDWLKNMHLSSGHIQFSHSGNGQSCVPPEHVITELPTGIQEKKEGYRA